MNKQRRAMLAKLVKELTDAHAIVESQLSRFQDSVEEIVSKLESVQDAEQDAFDNSPQSVQDGEQGSRMADAITSIQEAMDKLSDVAETVTTLNDNVAEAVSAIEAARGDK